MTGCLTGGVRPVTQFYLDPTGLPTTMDETGPVLAVRPLRIPRIYRQKIIYRDHNQVLGQYDFYEWSEPPSEAVTRLVMEALRSTGRFGDVALAAELRSSDGMLTGEILAFDEDRTLQPPHARCEMRLELRGGPERAFLWADTFVAVVPMARNDVSALPEAMTSALNTIMDEVVPAIQTVALPTEPHE